SYKMTYRKGGEDPPPELVETYALMCVQLYKLLKRSEISNYKTELAALQKLLTIQQIRREDVTNDVVNEDIRSPLLQNRTPEALAYLGSESWPDDFLLAFGSAITNGCAGTRIGFYAIPRRLYTLIAVIEAKSGSVELQGMTFNVDPQDKSL